MDAGFHQQVDFMKDLPIGLRSGFSLWMLRALDVITCNLGIIIRFSSPVAPFVFDLWMMRAWDQFDYVYSDMLRIQTRKVVW